MSQGSRKHQTLKINEQKQVLTIQTSEIALQAIFSSPILDVCNYYEQFQKYNYRAALSSINLKQDEFDEYYSAVRQRVDNFYNNLVYRSVRMIQDLLIAVRFAKIQMWREQTMITNGLRSHLYCKDIDPYNFNPGQFAPDMKIMGEMLKSGVDCKSSQETVIKLLEKLKEVQSAKMEEMFNGKVQSPYLAANKQGVQVDPSALYESYLSYLLTKMERADQSIFRRHFVIHDQIVNFGQAIFDHNLKYQKYASIAIKKQAIFYQGTLTINRYNDSLPNDYQATNIAPTIKMEARRQHIDVDELLPGRQNRSQSKPALINKATRVEFKQQNRVLDLQTMNQQLFQQIKNEERNHYERKLPEQTAAVRESPFETFAEQRRVIYKDYFQHRDFQKKMRDEEFRYGNKDFRERQKERIVIRRIIRTLHIPAPWLELTQYQYPFFQFLQNRNDKEHVIWETKNKNAEKNASSLNFYSKRERENPLMFIGLREREQRPRTTEIQQKLDQQQKQKMERERQEAFAFEDKRVAQQQARLIKLRPKMMNRTYEKFMQMNKLQVIQASANTQQIRRYGITLSVTLPVNDVTQMDKFFYYYFKERYYRQNESVKEMADNPIIFLDSKKVNMSVVPKVVNSFISSIVKRVQTMTFFLVWSDDLITFRLKESKQKKIAEFNCYSYTQSNNCQKLLYEIRRRVNLQIKEIYNSYTKLEPLEIVWSKVQVCHRMIFNRHKIMPAPISSSKKGRQLVQQIFQDLRER